MKTISCDEMKKMDSYAINEIGIPGIVLMENAALKVIENIDLKHSNSFTVVCGTGNNGGDGIAVARHLILKNKRVKVYIVGNTEKGTGDFKINLNILNNLKSDCSYILNHEDILSLRENLLNSDLAVDAIFGIGLARNVEGLYFEIIQAVNSCAKYIISVDVPSGLNGDTGEPMGIAVKADRTVVFHMMKKGLADSREYTGDVSVEDIGIPYLGR